MQTLLCKCNFVSVPPYMRGSSRRWDLEKHSKEKFLKARCLAVFLRFHKFPPFCFLSSCITWRLDVLCAARGPRLRGERHGAVAWRQSGDRLSWQPWCDRCLPRLPLSSWRCSGVYLAILRLEPSFIIPPLTEASD